MEESLSSALKDAFGIAGKDYSQYSALPLAFLGDAVFSLAVREILLARGNAPADKLHREAAKVVKAPAQARMIRALMEELTKEEEAVYRRGRNAKPMNTAKNASREEYLEATGFEALAGYLYLSGEYERLAFLIKKGMEKTGLSI